MSDPGKIMLNSADPLQQANINLNYFNNDFDIIAIREGIRYSFNVLKNGEGFQDIIVDEYPWEMPLHSDDLMKRTVLDRSQISFYPCGTARLSKSIDQGVVDSALSVFFGITNLRVVDASVISVIPDCRIQNSVYMVAEKGADMIKVIGIFLSIDLRINMTVFPIIRSVMWINLNGVLSIEIDLYLIMELKQLEKKAE